MKKSIEATIEEILFPIVESKGFEIIDVEYVKEAGEFYLRVYLDKEGGISLNDCEIVSRELSEILDVKDPIKDNYCFNGFSRGERGSTAENLASLEFKIKTQEPLEDFLVCIRRLYQPDKYCHSRKVQRRKQRNSRVGRYCIF